MKKRHRMGLWMMAAMVCLAASGCGPAVQNKPEEPTQTIQSTQEQPTQTAEGISEERAKEIALAHAGVKEETLSGYSIKKDTEDGQKTYEIEFYVDNTKYEYEISRKDGEILKHETEIKDAKKNGEKETECIKERDFQARGQGDCSQACRCEIGRYFCVQHEKRHGGRPAGL